MEVFSLPFLFIGIYYFAKFIKNNFNLRKIDIVIWGMCTGAIAILKLNVDLIFLGLFMAIGIYYIKNKKEKEIIRWIKYGILGFIIIIVPFLIYLVSKGALVECLNSCYINCVSSFKKIPFQEMIINYLNMLKYINNSCAMTLTLVFIITASMFLIFKKINNKENLYLVLGTLLATLLNICSTMISSYVYAHYFVTFIPIVLLEITIILKILNERIKVKVKKYILCIFIILLTVSSYTDTIKQVKFNLTYEIPETTNYTKIQEYIVNHTNEDDTVQLIGGMTESVSANFKTKRLAASKYSYLLGETFQENVRYDMVAKLVEDIYNNFPKLIFINNNSENNFYNFQEDKEKWKEFILKEYEIDSASIEGYTIYRKTEK